MRLPRMQFTVRRLMVAVAVVAVLAGVWIQGERRRKEFSRYRFTYSTMRTQWIHRDRALSDYHQQMLEKYDFASRYPWLPVAPDPPEPK